MEERWLTVDDICNYLNVSNETVYKWIEQRAMPGHRVGRRRMFKQDEVDEWVRSGGAADPTLVAKARDRRCVPDPNKAGDWEKLREKALLKEFVEYKEAKKKFKVFRLEAVRAGFKKARQERDYAVIVAVADKIPNNVLEEDPKLLMWYDQAVTRMGGE